MNIADILKDCPKGTKLYSPIFGDVYLDCVSKSPNLKYPIVVETSTDDTACFTADGKFCTYYDGECMLFPSKENRDWSTFKTSKKYEFKSIEPQLPKTWEEFCKVYPIQKGEASISNVSSINTLDKRDRNLITDKNILSSKEYAEAMLALCQLIQLRNCYNDGWEPDWDDCNTIKYCLNVVQNRITKEILQVTNKVLAFKTKELRDTFFENFKDLLEEAKPLL